MKKAKRNKIIVTIVAVIALVAILSITLVGCGVIPTAQAATEDISMQRSVNNAINYLFPLNKELGMREFNGTIDELKDLCDEYGQPSELIGVQVPTVIDPDGTIHYKYETVLFENYAITIFEYAQIKTDGTVEYKHGAIRFSQAGNATYLSIITYPGGISDILCSPLKIYSE